MKLSRRQQMIHQNAVDVCKLYLDCEPRIIKALEEVACEKIHKLLKYQSLLEYAVTEMKLDREKAYPFITVSKKCTLHAPLRTAMFDGSLSLSKATRIVSAITGENAESLVEFAKAHTINDINHEVAKIRPRSKVKDQIKPLSEEWMAFQCSITKEVFEKLKRTQAVLSTKFKKFADYNDILNQALSDCLEKHDPVEKAKRAATRKAKQAAQTSTTQTSAAHASPITSNQEAPAQQRVQEFCLNRILNQNDDIEHHAEAADAANGQRELDAEIICQSKDSQLGATVEIHPESIQKTESKSSFATHPHIVRDFHTKPKRIPLTAEQKHAVYLRDKGRCTFVHPISKEKCNATYWTETHHIRSIESGGSNELENLTTLCSAHHDIVHQQSLAMDYQYSLLREPQAKYG